MPFSAVELMPWLRHEERAENYTCSSEYEIPGN
jgi:hypothetical protein